MNLKNIFKIKFSIVIIVVLLFFSFGKCEDLTIARLKYGGGGDWYSNPGSLSNLMNFIEDNTNLNMVNDPSIVDIDSPELFSYHYLYMNGHGNVYFSEDEVKRLRFYLENGGFLHADDNYGMDKSFRREIKKVFPDKELVELPFSHSVYHSVFEFPKGLPKVHEHDGKPPQGFGIFHNKKLVVFYTYECDLGDGWEDAEVHHDPLAIRIAALKMGTNIYYYHLEE
jgi:hypothetical protein